MKQLVNLFRTARRKNEQLRQNRKTSRRRLHAESLEKRQLLAGDILVAHNFNIPEDVNRDFKVTAVDALNVINHLGRNGGSHDLSGMVKGDLDRYYDVTGDNKITALDALRVINRISRGEAVGELVELRLNARTQDDAAFTTEFNLSTRDLTVDVNEVFNLEVQYSDLRNVFGGDAGAFAVFADIATSLPNTLEPVLTETQILAISGNVRTATAGNLFFALTSAPATRVTVSQADFFDDAPLAIRTALGQLGFDTTKTTVTALAGDATEPLFFQIRFGDLALVDQDISDVVVTSALTDAGNAAVVVTSTNDSIEPRNPNGSINSNSVPFNINYLSRTFGANLPFYGFNGTTSGAFNSASGFAAVGGGGPVFAGGVSVSGGQGRLIEPFDAFSIPVRVRSAVTDLRVSIAPSVVQDAGILLYEADDPVPNTMVLVNLGTDDNVATDGFGFINITAVVGAVVVTANDSTLAATEDINATLNLAPLVTVQGSTTAPVFTVTTQPARGTVSISGTTATFDNALDDFTVAGTPLTFVYTATVGTSTDTGTVTVNIAPVNDPPVFVADTAVNATRAVPLTIVGSTLLANDRPGPANESGTVTITGVTAASAQGGTVTLSGPSIVYTSATAFTGADTITYTISDGATPALTTTATLTVNVTAGGVTVAANNSNLAVTEDINAPLNLSTLVTVGGSSTVPTFTITTQPTRGTVTIAAGTANATFDPAQDDFTVAGSPLTFVYTATVGSVSDTGTITVNIAPVNDPPVFAADTAVAATRGVALTIVGSTLLVNDRPGPANETGTVSIVSVTAASAQGGTVTLTGGNIIYTSAANFTGADTITYLISDGATPALTTTATLTVNVVAGGTVTVDATNSALAVTEDINSTLNLSTLTSVTGSSTVPTFTIVTQPARGTVAISGTTATFDPAQDDFTVTGSPLTFVYRATVGTVSDTATVTVNVAAVNDPPVFVADAAVAATRGVALTVAGSTLLANDRPGPANETGTVTIAGVTAASSRGGTVTLSGQNIVYTSASTFTGADTITYSISDGALTTTATLTINVSAPGATTVTANDSTLPVTEDINATLNLTSLVTVTNSSTAPTFTIVTQPARGTLALTGSSITYTPALNDFTTTPLSFVYRAAVGSVSDTGTVTINIAAVNDPPITIGDAVFARPNIATTYAATVVTTNDRPGPANETGTVTVTAVSAITGANATTGTVSLVNGSIVYTPLAGFLGTDRFQYTVSDGSATATGIVAVTVADFVPSTISGKIFTDFLESLANPIRDGQQDPNEPAMGGLSVRLSTAGSADVVRLTDSVGNYAFTNLAPGTYTVKFEIPDTIIPGSRVAGSTPTTTLSSSSFQVVIAAPGGLNATGNNFTVLGTQGSVADTLDILVSQNRRRGSAAAPASSFAVLSRQGDQQFFQLGDGFQDARFVELAVSADRDTALLTVLKEDGSVESSLLSGGSISVSDDGKVVGLLGDLNDLTPVTDSASELAAEFGDYRDAIDAILAGGTI